MLLPTTRPASPTTRQPNNPSPGLSPVPPNGLLLIDKPAGITSHDVVNRVRKIAGTRRVGHAGTLDPFATGLLIIGVNKGTKMLTNLVGLDKSYEATATLGATSTTDDLTGTITNCELRIANSSEPTLHPLSRASVEAVLALFRGGYRQIAPIYSAKKIGGKKLYELARAGKTEGITLPQKDVTISRLEMTGYEWPNFEFEVDCSSGTYIRALARDIGSALECGAYLTALRRTRIGPYNVRDAIRLDDLTHDMIEANVFSI